jgi:hypothetical protein
MRSSALIVRRPFKMAFPSTQAPGVEFRPPLRDRRVAVKVSCLAARIRAIGNSCERAKIEATACDGRKALPKRPIPSRFLISYMMPFRRGDL